MGTESSLSTHFVDYSDGSTVFEGYAAVEAGATEARSCVLLLHEWSGLNDGMQRIADKLASLGYFCFALDVYGKGIRGDQTADNSHLMSPLLEDRALLRRRLLAGAATAARHPLARPGAFAAMGYCFGGLCALDLARANPEGLTAAISVHGVFQPPCLGEQAPINASVLLLHGWEDPLAPPPDVLAIAKELTDAKADWQIHAYGHALHAFTFEGANMPERGIAYNSAAARRSWAALGSFLQERFDGGS
jgi:dienelactone hydrolase